MNKQYEYGEKMLQKYYACVSYSLLMRKDATKALLMRNHIAMVNITCNGLTVDITSTGTCH